ncbi:MAG: hypothetical protein ACJ0G1_08325 [Gammaproteobacteria bacterium]
MPSKLKKNGKFVRKSLIVKPTRFTEKSSLFGENFTARKADIVFQLLIYSKVNKPNKIHDNEKSDENSFGETPKSTKNPAEVKNKAAPKRLKIIT